MFSSLRAAIDACLAGTDRRAVAHAAAALSDAYRSSPDRPTLRLDEAARLAYLATRFPATLAALAAVARETAQALDLSQAETLVELGAGPGPARWAFAGVMPALARVHLVDRDRGLLELGRTLDEHTEPGSPVEVTRTVADIARLDAAPDADVVVLSYAIGELRADERERVVARAWKAARVALVLVEPGTTAGFLRVLEARRLVLEDGGHVAAPCPHHGPCPMQSPDWCHMPVRLERSRLHQQLKGARVGFEDEKFSCVVMSRPRPTHRATARVVDQPEVHSGHVVLRLCTASGLEKRTVARREGDVYRLARHAKWGGRFDPEASPEG